MNTRRSSRVYVARADDNDDRVVGDDDNNDAIVGTEDDHEYIINTPINVAYMKDRIEVANQVVANEINVIHTTVTQSIQIAKDIPQFKITVKLSMDDKMREIYNSTVLQTDIEDTQRNNISKIEDVLRIRNQLLMLTNENYFKEKFAEPSPTALVDARNMLVEM
jgi:hypothetical protein